MTVSVMPNVFVIPPEEDNESPFCCFDAADPLEPYTEEELELEGPGSALEVISRQFSNRNSPAFHRDGHSSIIMPRRSGGRSIQEVLEDVQDPDITIRGSNSPGDDSEIVEIIKVRRHTQDERESRHAPPPSSVSEPAFKTSKSFRARASKAFSSIKNVGRSVSRSRIHMPEDVPSDVESSRAPSPAPSRRSSVIFSSLFSHSPSLRSTSSFDSSIEPTPSASYPDPLDIQLHTPSSAEMQAFGTYPDTDTDTDDDNDGEEEIQTTPRPEHRSPVTRSLSPTKSNRRRFSVLNLFSASRDSEAPDAGPSAVTSSSTPTLPTLSPRTDSSESSVSSGPTTPVDDTFPELLPTRQSTSLLKRLPSFSRSPRKPKDKVAPVILAKPTPPSPALEIAGEDDLSFGEIRLDSFHFDEISFDASRF
jgi:hypothetical protein